MLPLVMVQVDEFHRFLGGGHCRLSDPAWFAYEAYDRTVMVLVRLHVQQGHAFRRPDSIRDSLYHVLPPPLAKVRDALHQPQSFPQEDPLTLGSLKDSQLGIQSPKRTVFPGLNPRLSIRRIPFGVQAVSQGTSKTQDMPKRLKTARKPAKKP